MPGFFDITKRLKGHYVEIRSKVSGKTWKGKVKSITTGESTRRVVFDNGNEFIAHKAASFSVKFLD